MVANCLNLFFKKYNGLATPIACGNYLGEVEDYTVFIKCLDPDRDEVCNAVDVCEGFSDIPLTLTKDPTANETIVTVNASMDVVYKAGTFTTLSSGFEAKSGATFQAMIEDCTTNSYIFNQ